MSFYSQYIFPRLMDAALGSKPIQEIRKTVLLKVEGEVFEIGFGTGLNLPHYPSRVRRITTVDPNPGAFRIARDRINRSGIEVINLTLGGEKLPLDNEKFDSVVCTFTLCSIQQVDKALQEMRRILKPTGRFHFVEHGLSDNPRVQWWQQKLTPLQRWIGDGCHLNRDTAKLLRQNGFQVEQLENFYLKGVPRFGGYLYQGVAVKR